MKTLVHTGLIVALSVFFAACGGNTTINGVDCDPEIPYSTGIMRYEWVETEALFWNCNLNVEWQYDDCVEQAADDPGQLAVCFQNYENNSGWCRYGFELQLNKTPLRECGAVIFEIPEGTDPQNYMGGKPSEADTDGDGITDYWEFQIGLNPCEAYSEGECSVGDANWDYDKDDKDNGKEEETAPICNPNDPLYSGDCV